uniref:Phosphofurin acidic cluster sorting protein 1 n=3 Tax=Parascaris univalens TaxID=6257 RepID=A0A915CAI6_PARUN
MLSPMRRFADKSAFEMENTGNRIVPMRLFANWETDRASAGAVQRMFTMALSRLSINSFPDHNCTLVVTVKLQGCKRTLRSNDFAVTAINGKLDVDLNISFTIQYPHFLKRKGNVLQILLQRRKRYKNRQIPGYKTLAVGTVNLAEILQNGSLREIALFDPDSDKDEVQPNSSFMGRLFLASCQSQTFEVGNEVTVRRVKEKELESEEEEDSSTDMPYSENEQELPDSSRSAHKRRMKVRGTRQRAIAQRKNLKQKFASLLKKFRVPEEGGVDAASQSAGVAPTAQELEELFEELEDLSDSGPEMVMDNLSIVSNPRPGLRPYFASTSSREILPAINDERGQSDESDEEWSSEVENNIDAVGMPSSVEKRRPSNGRSLTRGVTAFESASSAVQPIGNAHTGVHASLTLGSIAAQTNSGDLPPNKRKISLAEMKLTRTPDPFSPRTVSISDQLSSVLRDDEPWSVPKRIWICTLSELPVLALLDPSFGLLDCSSFNDCRQLISSIVARIQKFCNSSSCSPPCTILGVIGGEKLLNYVLRAYVESLQNKSTEWINLLRFCVIAPPASAIGKALSCLEDGQCIFKEIFERPCSEMSLADVKALGERLQAFADGALYRLPIGETMLQLHSKSGDDKDGCSQVFVPFLSEVRVGQLEDDPENSQSSPRINDENQVSSGSSPAGAYWSPPSSPHSPQRPSDTQDLQIEYWISTNHWGETTQSSAAFVSPSTSGSSSSRKDTQLMKCSIRSAFRSFTVFRKPPTSLLLLQFVKERKREKMLHKLGMKKGQKSDPEAQTPTQTIGNVARLICSGKHPLNVWIDGCAWTGVRFFQTSAQWQTHVKHFPICLPMQESPRRV